MTKAHVIRINTNTDAINHTPLKMTDDLDTGELKCRRVHMRYAVLTGKRRLF